VTTEHTLAPTRASPVRVGRARSRPVLLGWLGVVALVVLLCLGVAVGSVAIAPLDTLAVIVERLFGVDLGLTLSKATETIVWDLRVPRVLTAMVVGTALAVAGATFQGLLRNPLADPYVLGTASGAALGAAVAVLLPIRFVFLGFSLLHGLAFVGALVSIYTVYRLSRISGLAPLTSLLLVGYAVGSLLAAGLAMAMYLSGAALRQIFSYLLGGFDSASWPQLAGTFPLVAIGTALILLRARSLNGLLLGEEAAAHLGLDVRRERAILLALASLVTAAAVAVSGLIGFVGLVVPHVVRLVVGPSARLVLPLSALAGAALLAFADIVARAAGEIPVGIVTALIGAPFFIVLLRRARTGYEL
jgi:iron complex transport system permease protein